MSEQVGTINQKAAREQLYKRVQHDFTFKTEFNPKQMDCWIDLRKRFDTFRMQMVALVDSVPEHQWELIEVLEGGEVPIEDSRPSIFLTDMFLAYKVALRETERQCNSAIANDWETGDPMPDDYHFEIDVYDGPSGGTSLRNEICDAISKHCYELICELVMFLPLGRHLSIAVTRMEDVRGWLLDIVNLNWKPDAIQPPIPPTPTTEGTHEGN